MAPRTVCDGDAARGRGVGIPDRTGDNDAQAPRVRHDDRLGAGHVLRMIRGDGGFIRTRLARDH